jgi:hypothetical protein
MLQHGYRFSVCLQSKETETEASKKEKVEGKKKEKKRQLDEGMTYQLVSASRVLRSEENR